MNAITSYTHRGTKAVLSLALSISSGLKTLIHRDGWIRRIPSARIVEPQTGKIEIRKYIAVDDCGKVINPLLVDGQIKEGSFRVWDKPCLKKSSTTKTASF